MTKQKKSKARQWWVLNWRDEGQGRVGELFNDEEIAKIRQKAYVKAYPCSDPYEIVKVREVLKRKKRS